jgi:hypothetical protein
MYMSSVYKCMHASCISYVCIQARIHIHKFECEFMNMDAWSYLCIHDSMCSCVLQLRMSVHVLPTFIRISERTLRTCACVHGPAYRSHTKTGKTTHDCTNHLKLGLRQRPVHPAEHESLLSSSLFRPLVGKCPQQALPIQRSMGRRPDERHVQITRICIQVGTQIVMGSDSCI